MNGYMQVYDAEDGVIGALTCGGKAKDGPNNVLRCLVQRPAAAWLRDGKKVLIYFATSYV